MVGPEEDGDLSPEYRAKAAERAPGEEKINVTGMGRLNRIVVPVPEGHFTDPHRQGWLQKRRAKMIEEIEANRRGEYTVPTWVLTLILVVVVVGLVLLFTLL